MNSTPFKFFLLAYYGISTVSGQVTDISGACLDSTKELFTNSALGAASAAQESALDSSISDTCGSDFVCTIDFATLGSNAAEYASACREAGGTVYLYDLSSSCTATAFATSETGTLSFENVEVCVEEASCSASDVARTAETAADLVLNLVAVFIQSRLGGVVDVACDATITVSDDEGNTVASGRLGESTLAPTPAPTPMPSPMPTPTPGSNGGNGGGGGGGGGDDTSAAVPSSMAGLGVLGVAAAVAMAV